MGYRLACGLTQKQPMKRGKEQPVTSIRKSVQDQGQYVAKSQLILEGKCSVCELWQGL